MSEATRSARVAVLPEAGLLARATLETLRAFRQTSVLLALTPCAVGVVGALALLALFPNVPFQRAIAWGIECLVGESAVHYPDLYFQAPSLFLRVSIFLWVVLATPSLAWFVAALPAAFRGTPIPWSAALGQTARSFFAIGVWGALVLVLLAGPALAVTRVELPDMIPGIIRAWMPFLGWLGVLGGAVLLYVVPALVVGREGLRAFGTSVSMAARWPMPSLVLAALLFVATVPTRFLLRTPFWDAPEWVVGVLAAHLFVALGAIAIALGAATRLYLHLGAEDS